MMQLNKEYKISFITITVNIKKKKKDIVYSIGSEKVNITLSKLEYLNILIRDYYCVRLYFINEQCYSAKYLYTKRKSK